jgi:bifunctional non-homologous end joining protein LigD
LARIRQPQYGARGAKACSLVQAEEGIPRGLPLSMRKTNLARLLARRPDGIFAAPFEQGEIGPDLFRAACNMGLEGLVSKRADRRYRAGRSKDWIKVKNRKHPAMSRVKDQLAVTPLR